MKSKSEQMKEAIREISSKDEVTFDEYRTFVKDGLTFDEYRALGDEIVEKLLEHGDIVVFDDTLDAGEEIGDCTGVPDVFIMSPRNDDGTFSTGCRR